MDRTNLQFLQNTVKFMSFDESLLTEMQRKMKEGVPEFQLKAVAHFNKDEVGALLYFRKSDKSELYFFNKYDVVVLHQDDPSRDRSQTFYNHNGTGVTFKEAYNLLEGRAVHKSMLDKEGKKITAWIQLDFSQTTEGGNYKMRYFHDSYGFDLEKALDNLPVCHPDNGDDREMLLISLKRGNRQVVTLMVNGQQQQGFIEAAPQYKSLNVYDTNLKRIRNFN